MSRPYTFTEKEKNLILLYAANEICAAPKIKEQIINIYNEDDGSFGQYLPDASVMVSAADTKDFPKVYSVLSKGAFSDSDNERIAKIILDAVTPAPAQGKGNGPTVNAEPDDEGYKRFLQHIVTRNLIFSAKYIYIVNSDCDAIQTARQGIEVYHKAVTFGKGVIGATPADCLTFSETLLENKPEEDQIIMATCYTRAPFLKKILNEAVEVIDGLTHGNLDLATFRSPASFFAEDYLFTGYVGCSKSVNILSDQNEKKSSIYEAPARFKETFVYIASMTDGYFYGQIKTSPGKEFLRTFQRSTEMAAARMAAQGIDLCSLIRSSGRSVKTLLKPIIARAWWEEEEFTEADIKKEEVDLFYFSYRIFSTLIILLLHEKCQQIIEECNSSEEGQGRADQAISEIKKDLEHQSKKYGEAQKKLEEKEKRVKEQDKIICRLEKEKADAEKKAEEARKAKEKAEKERDEAAALAAEAAESADDVLEEEFLPSREDEVVSRGLTLEEAREYFEEIIETETVFFFGARDNLLNRLLERYPNLIFKTAKTTTPTSMARADMVILHSSKTSHSMYKTVKKMAKNAGLPFKHLNKHDFNEKHVFDAVIDMYESN